MVHLVTQSNSDGRIKRQKKGKSSKVSAKVMADAFDTKDQKRTNKEFTVSAKRKKFKSKNVTKDNEMFTNEKDTTDSPDQAKGLKRKAKGLEASVKRKKSKTKDVTEDNEMVTNETTPDTRAQTKVLKRKDKWLKASAKRKKLMKKNASEEEANELSEVPAIRNSDDPLPVKEKWTNKQRLLIFARRGITVRDKLVMEDLQRLLPHSKRENKRDGKNELEVINEIAELRKCNKCIYFVAKKKKDLYMWLANVPGGPSAKFLVQKHHTMRDKKMTGNCLVGSRPLLCFDSNFDAPHWSLMKDLISQIFNVPQRHPKSQPFIDRVFVFSLVDNKIYFRNYQIVEEDGQLTEIGPRFVLYPIKIFEGSFCGKTLWSNPQYVSPNANRASKKERKAYKSLNKEFHKRHQVMRNKLIPTEIIGDPTSEFFQTKPPEEAKGKEKILFHRRNKVEKKKIVKKTVKKV